MVDEELIIYNAVMCFNGNLRYFWFLICLFINVLCKPRLKLRVHVAWEVLCSACVYATRPLLQTTRTPSDLFLFSSTKIVPVFFLNWAQLWPDRVAPLRGRVVNLVPGFSRGLTCHTQWKSEDANQLSPSAPILRYSSFQVLSAIMNRRVQASESLVEI